MEQKNIDLIVVLTPIFTLIYEFDPSILKYESFGVSF